MLNSSSNFSRRLLRWYDRARRDLPWRPDAKTGRTIDPYRILISEAMLQQTQVATVIPYFDRFIARFPSLSELAAADEQEVLRLWQGLGYYSRARNLLAAARRIMHELGGELPSTVQGLLMLPGIGRYTAGAIASIAFNKPAPILDGNVIRVLCRLDAIQSDPRRRDTQKQLWARAAELLPGRRVGDFNSALMELGATVCTPRSPQCLICPVQSNCQALAVGLQERIPAPKKRLPTPLYRRVTYCIRDGPHYLLEQRPAHGRWAGMWQFLTVADDVSGKRDRGELSVHVERARRLGTITHSLTHRRYEFKVFVCRMKGGRMLASNRELRWTTLARLSEFPLPRPHVRIAEMLREAETTLMPAVRR